VVRLRAAGRPLVVIYISRLTLSFFLVWVEMMGLLSENETRLATESNKDRSNRDSCWNPSRPQQLYLIPKRDFNKEPNLERWKMMKDFAGMISGMHARLGIPRWCPGGHVSFCRLVFGLKPSEWVILPPSLSFFSFWWVLFAHHYVHPSVRPSIHTASSLWIACSSRISRVLSVRVDIRSAVESIYTLVVLYIICITSNQGVRENTLLYVCIGTDQYAVHSL